MRYLERHSGLKGDERDSRMHSFRPLRFKTEAYTQQRVTAKAMLEKAVADRSGLYTLYGDFGSGKTLGLQVIVNEMRVLDMREGYYAPFASVIDHLRQLFSRREDTSDYWQRLLDIPVLALDEVTRFNEDKGWIQERLFVLVDTRYRQRGSHLTLFATNADPNAVLPPEEPIGYLFSRMREGQLCELRGDVRSAIK